MGWIHDSDVEHLLSALRSALQTAHLEKAV
jgi:hypothetical protein